MAKIDVPGGTEEAERLAIALCKLGVYTSALTAHQRVTLITDQSEDELRNALAVIASNAGSEGHEAVSS